MMKIMAAAIEDVGQNLKTVIAAMQEAADKRSKDMPSVEPRLVAISKTKSVLLIKKAYDAGQRHFGENYVKELLVKAKDPDLNKLCPDIKWHYVGHLQKNKIAQLISCPRLFMIETVSSQEVADSLQKKFKDGSLVNVMIQINTSGEASKSGILPDECVDLARHMKDNCHKLKICGIMTIGMPGHDFSTGPNPDFECMTNCRKKIAEHLKIPIEELELSMGMSADFQEAIMAGSTNIRVGSTIFGAREK